VFAHCSSPSLGSPEAGAGWIHETKPDGRYFDFARNIAGGGRRFDLCSTTPSSLLLGRIGAPAVNCPWQEEVEQMIPRKTLAIAVFALSGLATAPCAAGDILGLQTSNWSGYAVVSTPAGQSPPSTTFTEVRANWQQPTVICTTPNARTAIWVGLDGLLDNSGTVEQLGTIAICGSDPNETAPLSYKAWWEMKADGTASPHATEFDVFPGDRIEANVTFSNGAFVLHLEDRTTRRSFTTPPQACPPNHTCPRSSAEFIVERPGETPFPLGDYQSMMFTGVGVRRQTSNQNFQWAKVTMRARDSSTTMSSCGALFEENLDQSFVVLPRFIGCEWQAATP
jgi:Peptidase A4 family